MDINLEREIPQVRLRAFRAIDDPETCMRFIEGHQHVLEVYNLKMVTSANYEWIKNPAVFVIVVESLDKTKLYGGARIHVAGGTQPLPVEEAIGRYDPRICDLVRECAIDGTGEGCGLWNSREIAGYGVGSIFLSRVGVAISSQIGIKTLFALCAPYTVKLAESIGYQVDNRLGDHGTFYYPREGFVATSMFYPDIQSVETASEEDKISILDLRNNVNIVRVETLRKKQIEIHYDIAIPNINTWDLKEVTAKFAQ